MARQALILECKRRYAAGESLEELIKFLRGVGCSKIDSIAVVSMACEIGLAKAKEAVHFSTAWNDVRASDEKFHELIEDAVSQEKRNGSD